MKNLTATPINNQENKCLQLGIFSPAVAVDYTPISSSDIPPPLPLSGTPTPAPSSEAGPPMDGSPACGCMREAPGCSIHPNTPGPWIASMRASLVKILAQPVEAMESTANAPDFIGRSCDAPMLYDPDSYSWKTSQLSLVEDLGKFSGTWPSAGMMRDGRAWPLQRLVPTMSACGGGVWLMPRATDIGKGERSETFVKRMGDRSANCFQSLAAQVQKRQTPVADDSVERTAGKWNSRGEPKLSAQAKMWPTPSAGNFNASESLENWTARRERVKAEKKNGNGFGMPLGIAVRIWPTPTKLDGTGGPGNSGRDGGDNLRKAAAKFPSPAARDWRSGTGANLDNGHTPQLPEVVGGQLNPTWTAWLMGWPLEATKLEPSEMAKFLSRRRQRGKSLVDLNPPCLKCQMVHEPHYLPNYEPPVWVIGRPPTCGKNVFAASREELWEKWRSVQ